MTETDQLKIKQLQTFRLVLANFAMFLVLFAGLGYASWQSIALVQRLQEKLDQAEVAIDQLQERLQNVSMDSVADRLVERATTSLDESIREVVQESELAAPLTNATQKIDMARETLEQTAEAIQGIHQTIGDLDSESIARQVSYHILKGLGDGLQQAAQAQQATAE